MKPQRKKFWHLAGVLMNRFYERISKLPDDLQEDLLNDLETAMENSLKVLERVKK